MPYQLKLSAHCIELTLAVNISKSFSNRQAQQWSREITHITQKRNSEAKEKCRNKASLTLPYMTLVPG